MPATKRYKVKCGTKGGTPRTLVIYAPSIPKAKTQVLDPKQTSLGIGNARIISVLEVELSPELDLRNATTAKAKRPSGVPRTAKGKR